MPVTITVPADLGASRRPPPGGGPMNRFEWDGLTVGEVVHVHVGADPGPARHGAVAFFARPFRAPAEVGVRLDDGSVVWPAARAVHRDAVAPTGVCWRCADVARTRTA